MSQENSKKNFVFLCVASSLLIFTPGRFAYAVILLSAFCFQIFFLTIFSHFIFAFHIENQKTALIVLAAIFCAVLSREILFFLCPSIVFTLGFLIFLPAVQTTLLSLFFDHEDESPIQNVLQNFSKISFLLLFSLLFFLLRDIFGYGTLTLPSFSGIVSLKLPFCNTDFSALAFLASIPGAFILLALIFAFFSFVAIKFNFISKNDF